MRALIPDAFVLARVSVPDVLLGQEYVAPDHSAAGAAAIEDIVVQLVVDRRGSYAYSTLVQSVPV